MRRQSALLAAIAIAAALTALTAGLASGAGPEEGTWVKVELGLKTNNDLHAHLENAEDGTVTLELQRPGQIVKYEALGMATETGLKVRFGRLGRFDVSFAPTKTLSSTEPGEGCSGAPRTLHEGDFSGTIDFAGEKGYVRIEAPRVHGSMGVISQWECPAEPTDPFDPFAQVSAAPAPGQKRERETATLSAFDRACFCAFAAGVHHRHSGGKSIFYGYRLEQREGMKIVRFTKVIGPASAFDFDHAAGTATLRPPSPLTGSATFSARPDRRPLWRSTIRVPLLGADPLDPGAPGFAVQLHREYQFD